MNYIIIFLISIFSCLDKLIYFYYGFILKWRLLDNNKENKIFLLFFEINYLREISIISTVFTAASP